MLPLPLPLFLRRAARVAALACVPVGMLGCGADAGGDPIHLGIAGPLDQPSGRGMRMAAEMAVEEINRVGGVRGRPLQLVLKDDQAKPERAIEVAAELRDDPRVVAVIGHINSGATLAAAEVYNDSVAGVVQISPASSNPRVSEAGPWTFRVCPSDLQHGPALAQWAFQQLGRRKAEVLYANDEYGRGVLESFAVAFEQAGGQIVGRDPYLLSILKSDDALDPYLQRAIQRGMDALVVAGQADGGLKALRAARRLGYTGPVLGADGLTNVKDAGALAEEVYISSAYLPDRPTVASQNFVREYLSRYKELPDHRAAMTYDAIRLIARSLGAVGTDRLALRDHIASVGSGTAAFDGVSGTISFDENGDVREKEVAVGVVRSGRLVTPSRERAGS